MFNPVVKGFGFHQSCKSVFRTCLAEAINQKPLLKLAQPNADRLATKIE